MLAVPSAAAGDGTAPTVSIASRAVQPGEVLRLLVTCTCNTAPTVSLLGTSVPLVPAGGHGAWEGLAGIDLDVRPGAYPLSISTAAGALHTSVVTVAPKQFRTRTLRVASEYVEPPADVVNRIVAEADLLQRIFSDRTPPTTVRAFVLPIARPPAANFGARSVFNGTPRQPHAGIDFSSPSGTRVTAPADGRIVYAGTLFFTGNTVIVDHGGGLYSLFAHLSSLAVEPEAAVTRGDLLGRVGSTGRSTGPHLHWSVRLNGARVDPLSLVGLTASSRPNR